MGYIIMTIISFFSHFFEESFFFNYEQIFKLYFVSIFKVGQLVQTYFTAQKMKFSIKDFFSKCEKSLTENFIA